jgi:hypothetical protein
MSKRQRFTARAVINKTSSQTPNIYTDSPTGPLAARIRNLILQSENLKATAYAFTAWLQHCHINQTHNYSTPQQQNESLRFTLKHWHMFYRIDQCNRRTAQQRGNYLQMKSALDSLRSTHIQIKSGLDGPFGTKVKITDSPTVILKKEILEFNVIDFPKNNTDGPTNSHDYSENNPDGLTNNHDHPEAPNGPTDNLPSQPVNITRHYYNSLIPSAMPSANNSENREFYSGFVCFIWIDDH